MSGGRPTDYKPEYCQMVIDHMSQGFPFETFAAEIGTHRATLYNWREKYPEFFDASKKGQELCYKWFLTVGRASMLGLESNGKKIHANPTFWIFMMKNMHKWHDKQQLEHVGKDEGPIQYEGKSEKELDRMIEKAVTILKNAKQSED